MKKNLLIMAILILAAIAAAYFARQLFNAKTPSVPGSTIQSQNIISGASGGE